MILTVTCLALCQLGPQPLPANPVEALLVLANRERSRVGLMPLTLNESLVDSAQWFAEDMATHSYFDHLDGRGRRVGSRVYDFGYRAYQSVAENIAAGQETPQQVFDSWMSSTGHRRNILNPDLKETGIGFASGSTTNYRTYWVQTFGKRPDYLTKLGRKSD